MEKFKIGNKKIEFYGKAKGSNSNKFNRVNKLARMYNDLSDKLHGMAKRGMSSCTEQYRCSVATLLLLETGIRVGNETSAEGYNTVPHPHAKNQESKFVKTYGLTTLLRKHVLIDKREKSVSFEFSGKKQVTNYFDVPDSLAKYVIGIYSDCGKEPMFGITDYQLTKFIKRYVGRSFTPKDFRTLRANIYAYDYLNRILNNTRYIMPITKKECKVIVKYVCESVSDELNNTPGVCKKSYIDDNLFINNLY